MAVRKRKQLFNTLSRFYQNPVAKVSLELFLSVATIIFFALFAIKPTLLTMSDLVKEIEDKKSLDKKLSQKVAALSTAQATYVGLQSRIGVLDDALPTGPHLIETLKIIEKIASEQGLVISTIGVSVVPDEIESKTKFSDLKRVPLVLKIGVEGDYLAIRDFVGELQLSRRSLITETIYFNLEEIRDVRKLKATISVTASYFGRVTAESDKK